LYFITAEREITRKAPTSARSVMSA